MNILFFGKCVSKMCFWTLQIKQITSLESAFNTFPENGVRSCVIFAYKLKHGRCPFYRRSHSKGKHSKEHCMCIKQNTSFAFCATHRVLSHLFTMFTLFWGGHLCISEKCVSQNRVWYCVLWLINCKKDFMKYQNSFSSGEVLRENVETSIWILSLSLRWLNDLLLFFSSLLGAK